MGAKEEGENCKRTWPSFVSFRSWPFHLSDPTLLHCRKKNCSSGKNVPSWKKLVVVVGRRRKKMETKMCDTVSVRVTCETFQCPLHRTGPGNSCPGFLPPCCVAEWQTQSHPSPLACFVYTRHNGIRGEKLFGSRSQQHPFSRPK